MACLLHAPLLLLTTLLMTMNLNLNPILSQTKLAGLKESSMLEEGAKEALDYAVKKHSESNYNLYLSSVVDVLKVRKQVVSGKIFFFDVILGQSTCLKTQVDLTKCSLNDKAGVKEREFCSFEVYIVPGEDLMSLTTSNCHKI